VEECRPWTSGAEGSEEQGTLTVLCIATYEKGQEFLRECKRQGCRVLLLTADTLADADWPRESIDDFFFVPRDLPREDLLKGVSFVARRERIERIVALDDFDVEMAALLREHLRVPGMGETTARHFRDKLAMRGRAQNAGLPVPSFVPILNHDMVREFTERVPAPWILKPRSQAAAIGMKKFETPDDLWRRIDELGDEQSFYLLERFLPGDVYHVDSIVSERSVIFAEVHKYGEPPFQVAHHGGIFTTRTLPRDDDESHALAAVNVEVLSALGLVRGVTHTEFIKARADGELYFLETSARVGGAYIVNVVEAATGINLWREWAKLEIAGEYAPYSLPPHEKRYAGIALSLARQEHPDMSAYTDPEIVERLGKSHHAGLIVASDDPRRVEELMEQYARRFLEDFYAFAPAPDRPTA
jgi:hypothetical protein